jgi:hypothetical protein
VVHVNLLGDNAIKALKLRDTIARARAEMKARPYSGRNPQYGKMINCGICGRRHRQLQVVKAHPAFGGTQTFTCVQVFHKGREGSATEGVELIASQKTLKGIFGAQAFAKKRLHPHPSKRKLQLVERTQKLFYENEPYFTDAKLNMQESRDMAQRELKGERRKARRPLRRTQDVSRRINAGLALVGSRAPQRSTTKISPETFQKRRAKLDLRTAINVVVKEAEHDLGLA